MSWVAGLEDNACLNRRLALERGWGIRALRHLQIGFDGAWITISVRDLQGSLQRVLRYDPFGPRKPKMLAVRGTRLGPVPHPARIAQKYVLLVEGPPDMIAARSCGRGAIAVPGTSAWQSAWAEQLTGKHVRLVMDCDTPGRRAAAQIAGDSAPPGSRSTSSISRRGGVTATTSPTASSNAAASAPARPSTTPESGHAPATPRR